MSRFYRGYSYDDVLITPRLSIIKSRKNIILNTKLTKNINMKLPIISANMDTITEDNMAIAMAKNGGIGIIHRYCSIESQIQMVKNVKKNINYYVENPICINQNETIDNYNQITKLTGIKTLIVTDDNGIFTGIINKHNIDIYNSTNDNQNKKHTEIYKIMSSRKHFKILEYNEYITNKSNLKFFIEKMKNEHVKYIPVVNNIKIKKIVGLITLKDLLFYSNKKCNANLDMDGNLRVGAAIGVNGDYLERTKALINAKCDVLVIDIAHGHSILVGEAIKKIRSLNTNKYINIIAGNVATKEGVEYLANLGVDAIKVNIGAGSICTTRIMTGCGVPQFTAVYECSEEAKKYNIPIIADGGHCGKIGNMVKALAAGASSCMLGRMLGGTNQSPGRVLLKDGKKVKIIRGMAGYISNINKKRNLGESSIDNKFTPEGVEGYINYRGCVIDILEQIKGGIRSGLSYCGVENIKKLHENPVNFCIITSSGRNESNYHGIELMKN